MLPCAVKRCEFSRGAWLESNLPIDVLHCTSDSLREPGLTTAMIRGLRHIVVAAASGARPSSVCRSFSTSKRFTQYSIYKGKAALSIKPIPPTWKDTEYNYAMDRHGTLLLTFIPSTGQTGKPGGLQWKDHVNFGLSPSECGELINACDSRERASFYHDLGNGSTKTFACSPTPDEKAFFFNVEASGKDRIFLPISFGEYYVIKQLINFSLPRLLGFDAAFGVDNFTSKMEEGAQPAYQSKFANRPTHGVSNSGGNHGTSPPTFSPEPAVMESGHVNPPQQPIVSDTTKKTVGSEWLDKL